MRHDRGETVVRRRPLFPVLAVLGCLVTLTGVGSDTRAAEDQQQRGVALIARAAQLENLLSPEAGPLRLRAHVKLFGLVDGTREGEYLLMAASPTSWFESVRFPGYTELIGQYEGQRWRKRNVIDKPFRFYEVSQMFDLARHLRLPANAEIKKLAQKEVRGVQAFCLDASPTSDLWQKDSVARAALGEVGISKDSSVTLCFDAATGVVMSVMNSASLPRFEFEGQVTLGNKVFPKVLRCFEGKELAVEATVEDLAAEPNTEPAGFKPPDGADTWPSCDSPGMPKLIEKKPLDDSLVAHAKARRAFGTILCLAEIAPDGTIHDLAAVDWHGMLGELIRQAVKGWRYTPATCNGVPVPAQIYVAFSFTP